MPKVSVIIPVYNTEKYLRECLDSVVNQTLKDIEIICVDDGSTDGSLAILNEYAQEDERIIILKNKGIGAGGARNTGLDISTGEYLSFLDSDDIFEHELLEKLYNKILYANADIAICDADKFDSDGNKYHLEMLKIEKLPNKEVFNKIDIPKDIYNITLPASWNKLYRRKFIESKAIKFQELTSCNDVAFGYLALTFANAITVCPEVLVHYRKSELSITATRSRCSQNILYAYKMIKERLCEENLDEFISVLDKRMYSHIKYELSLCNENEQKKFTEIFKSLLPSEYKGFIEGEHIPVFISCDDSYAVAAAVCMYSILNNTKSYIDFIILSCSLSVKNYNKICKSIRKFKNYSIQLVNMNSYDLDKFPTIDRFGASCYARYFIPEIFKQYSKVIYTDADVIFKDDIKKYFEINMDGYGLAASSCELGKKRLKTDKYNYDIRKKNFDIEINHEYFSNGNLIIDCDYWRKHNMIAKLMEVTNKLEKQLIAPDLDVMNYCFQNNYKLLDYKYCVCVHRYGLTDGNLEMENAFKNPFIIHYSGNKKPWVSMDVAFFDDFWYFLKKTPFLWSSDVLKKYLLSKLKTVFSIKNVDVHKVVTILGLKLKFKSKKLVERKRINILETQLQNAKKDINRLLQNNKNSQLEFEAKWQRLETKIDQLKVENMSLQQVIEKLMLKDKALQQIVEKLKDDCIEDFAKLSEITMLKTKYHWNDIKVPQIKNNEETIQELINSNKSLIRFGDGEFSLMEGIKIVFQDVNQKLVDYLKEIFAFNHENLLIGIFEPYYDFPINLNKMSKRFVLNWLPKWHYIAEKYYNMSKVYYSTHISQAYPVFQEYDFDRHYNNLKMIWDDKAITIICGDRVFNNIEYNIFENAKDVQYIYGPTSNAFDKFDDLMQELDKIDRSRMLIFAIGPCGKALAYEMFKKGYRVLDLGHLVKDYDFYRKLLEMTKEEFDAARSKFFGKD